MEPEILIETAQKTTEIINKLEEIARVQQKVYDLKYLHIKLKNREKAYLSFDIAYDRFRISITRTDIYIDIKRKDGRTYRYIKIDNGEIKLGKLYELAMYKDQIFPILENELEARKKMVREEIDRLERMIKALELAGFKIQ